MILRTGKNSFKTEIKTDLNKLMTLLDKQSEDLGEIKILSKRLNNYINILIVFCLFLNSKSIIDFLILVFKSYK